MFQVSIWDRVVLAALLFVVVLSAQPSPSVAGEGLFMSATSSPSLSIGVETGRLGISAGVGFRWTENSATLSGSFVLNDSETSESIAVLIPTATLRLLSYSTTLPRYLLLRVEKDVPVASSVSGFEGFQTNGEYEEFLESQNSELRISGGFGARAPLSERLSLGGEFGIEYSMLDSELDSSRVRRTRDEKAVGTFFRLTMFLYL